jgi:magnesium transporter
MVRILYFGVDGTRQEIGLADLEKRLDAKEGLLWVDIREEPRESAEKIMLERFHFHPLSVADALQETHVPRIDDWGDYLYMVLRAVDVLDRDDTIEIDIFLGEHYLLTHRAEPVPVLEKLWEMYLSEKRPLNGNAGRLLYRIADDLATDYMMMFEGFEAEIEMIESRIFKNPERSVLELIFDLKRNLLHLRRVIGPQREVMRRLAVEPFRPIVEADRVFFRDVYDHFVRLHDLNDNLRDLVTGSLDTFLSMMNNKMNDVMRTLTIITTLFMPLSFLTGFFGMNFFQAAVPLGEWTGQGAFMGMLAAMIILPVGMLGLMRWRRWL